MPDEIMARKRLIDYLPPFMQDFAEIKAIMKTENPELDRAWLDIQIPLADAFIMDCDEYGIKKYEKFVGIVPDPEDNLDVRKARVLIWWNNFVPYTYRRLMRRLDGLCGTGNYEVSGSLESYELFLKTSLAAGGQMQELEHMLIQMVPMNMNCGAENEFVCKTDGFADCAGAVCCTEEIFITSDFEESLNLDGSSASRGGTCFINSIDFTSDFTAEVEMNGTSAARGLIGHTAEVQVSNDSIKSAQTAGDEKTAAFASYATRNICEPMYGAVSVLVTITEIQ